MWNALHIYYVTMANHTTPEGFTATFHDGSLDAHIIIYMLCALWFIHSAANFSLELSLDILVTRAQEYTRGNSPRANISSSRSTRVYESLRSG